MRSETRPQICRLKNAAPSRTDTMAAPCAALIPRSLQNATRWVCGIAIGMQQVKIAAICNANTRLGGQPRTGFATLAS